jgi:hypothetical protein
LNTSTKLKISARQRLLVTLLGALHGEISKTDFQKLLFLYTKEAEAEPSFEFVPYRFGCFSFGSYLEKRRLVELGILEDDEAWKLSEIGKEVSRERDPDALKVLSFAKEYKDLRGAELLREVYQQYPYYAIRSEILDKVLPAAKDREKVQSAKPSCTTPALLTVGYEGKTLETYLNQLIRAGADLLCDVRRNPLSRKYGFSKSTLSQSCETVGIKYEHIPELGIASSERRNLSHEQDYTELFAAYRRHTLPHNQAALERIKGWITKSKQRVALTCFERNPCECHRHCVAEAIADQTDSALLPLHLP